MPSRYPQRIWFTSPEKDSKKVPVPGRPDSDKFMAERSADLKRCERLALVCMQLPCGKHDVCVGCPSRTKAQTECGCQKDETFR